MNNIIRNNIIKNKNKQQSTIKCRFCGSNNCVKHGKTINNKERYYCKDCNKNFSLTDDRIKHPIEHILLALILVNKNISKRNIQKTLEEFFNIKLSFNVLDKWFKRFGYLIDNNKLKEKSKSLRIEVLEMDENKCIMDISLLNITNTEVC